MCFHMMVNCSFGRFANSKDQELGRRKKESFLVWWGRYSGACDYIPIKECFLSLHDTNLCLFGLALVQLF